MKPNSHYLWQAIAIFMLVISVAACTGAPHSTPTAAPILTVTPAVRGQQTPANPTETPSIPVKTTPGSVTTNTPTSVALNFSKPKTAILVKNLDNPDDLVLGSDHSLYLSDISKGLIEKIGPDGSHQVIATGLSTPEGMVYLPNGSIIIAEQGKNRLLKYDPVARALTLFLSLTNTTNQEGVDGLALDNRSPAQESVIIPDSPNGVLRRANLGGGTSTVIASGFSRPTGAWVEPDGSILVVDETTGYLTRVHPDGTQQQLARFSTPDDVIEDNAGNIYVNTLGDHAVHVLTAKGQDIVLVKNISDPQGIAFTADGNLAVTDPSDHQIIEIMIRNQS